MTRRYATFDCGIWDDPDFVKLTAGAQRTYFMLVTQRDLTACGLLALTLRRWSSMCADEKVSEWLEELSERRFVLIDETTEELLVRTFMKWDQGYKHAKRVQAVIATALAIRSLSIRSSALGELAKLGVSIGNREPIDSVRSVVTLSDHIPEPGTRNQEREPSAADASAGPPSMFCSKHPQGTEAPCGPCGDARKRYVTHTQATLAETVAAKRNALERRRACPDCDDAGMRVHPDTKLPLGRCDHAALAEVAS